jgi:hypothetical protein
MADDHTKRQFAIIRQLLRDPDLHPSAKNVGVFLADQTRRDPDPKTGAPAGHARISHPGIATALHLSERQVRYAIEALKDGGHLDVAVSKWRGGGRGRAHANTYRLLLKADPQGNFDFDGADEVSTPSAGLSARGPNTEYSTPSAGLRAGENRRDARPKSGNQCQKGGTPIAGTPSAFPSARRKKAKDGFKQRESGGSPSAEKTHAAQPRFEGAVALPEEPSPEMVTFAEQAAGWSSEIARGEYLDMVAWYAQKGDPIRDVVATWRLWVKRGNRNAERQNHFGGSKIGRVMEVIAARDGKPH